MLPKLNFKPCKDCGKPAMGIRRKDRKSFYYPVRCQKCRAESHCFRTKNCDYCQSSYVPTNPSNKHCSLICAFWANVDKQSETECWPWKGRPTKVGGYGVLLRTHKLIRAHRLSWEIHYGPIPAGNGYHGICVCHECDNPICVNPDHLFLGSQQQNIDDMVNKERRKGHYIGEKNPSAHLTEKQVINIREEISNGATYRYLAEKYNVGQSTIGRIKKGTHWKHI